MPDEQLKVDAARWRYVRDVLWKHVKRSDLPDDLYYFFVDTVDIKYPTANDLDAAIDKLSHEYYE